MTFPSPVGGTPLPVDFVPSIVFAVLHALLLPAALYRTISKRSRSTLLIGTTAFVVERIVLLSLRAAQSHNEAQRGWSGLTSYMQVSFGLGSISIAQDLANLLRCLLVNSTYGSPNDIAGPTSSELVLDSLSKPPPSASVIITGDQPHQRSLYRRFSGILQLGYWVVIILGTTSGSLYSSGIGNQTMASSVMWLRFASSALALFLFLITFAAAWAMLRTHEASTKSIAVFMHVTTLLIIVAIYRLTVMHNTTTAIDSTAPGSLNTRRTKAIFYVFHILPEWIAAASLYAVGTRETFATGPFGDRSRDETPEEKEKRRRKKEKKLERRGRFEFA